MLRRTTLLRRALAAMLATAALGACSSSTGESGSDAGTIPIVGGGTTARERSASGASATTVAAAPASGGASAITAAASAAAKVAGDEQAASRPRYPPAASATTAPPATPTDRTSQDNRSTFALDVDTASYTLARQALANGYLPDPATVRTEEFVNFFDQGWDRATERGLTLRADGARVPFLGPDHRVLRVGVQGQDVAAGDRKPAVLTLLVDTSGSMADAGKLDVAVAGLRRLVRSLGRDDTVEIVRFSSDASVVAERTRLGDGGENRLDRAIDALVPQDSTNLDDGMALAYERARGAYRSGAINRVVLVTDGLANTGATQADDILRRVREDAGKGIQLAAVGVGFGDYDDALLERLARDGDGFYAYVDQAAEAERIFAERLTGTLQTVALDGKAEVRFNPEVVRSYRLLGYDDRAIPDGSLQDPTVGGGETGAGHVTTALYDVELWERNVGGSAVLATATVHWTDPDERNGRERALDIAVRDLDRPFVDASVRLRQDVWVAAFAERLRSNGWSDRVSYAEVREGLGTVARELDGDADVRGAAALAAAAARLRG